MTERNSGNRGHFGLALQATAGTYVPPTTYLRETGGSGFMPDYLERMSKAFRGTAFEAPAEYAGSDYQGRTVNGEATVADIAKILQGMYGAPDAQGVIIPNDQTQYSDTLVLPPVSAQWHVPNAGHVQITDAQLYDFTLTVPESRTDLVTFALQFHAIKALWHPQGAPIAPFTPAAPVLPGYAGGLGRLEHSVTIGGVDYAPDSTSTVKFTNPVDPLPANGEYIGGFAPNASPIAAEFGMSWGYPIPAILAAHRDKTILPCVWRLTKAGTLVLVDAQVQVTAREVPVGDGRVRTTATLRARTTTPGVSPFRITVVTA